MSNEMKVRFDLTQDQKRTILDKTGEKAEALELTVEKRENSVSPRGFRMF